MKTHINSILGLTCILLVSCSNSKINNYDSYVNTFIADEALSPLKSIESLKAVDLFVLNDQHIGLVAQNSKSYLLTTADNCENMYFAKKLILLNAEEGVLKVSDKIVRVGEKHTECSITGMYKLHSVQLDLLHSAYMSRYRNPKGAVFGSSSYPQGI